jgi:hypothetical protein
MQFVESETGADFAVALSVSLKNIAKTQRHVLAQVKLIEQRDRIRLDRSQLAKLDEAAGGELSLYAVWGENTPPSVATVANLKAVLRANRARNSVMASSLLRFGRPLSEYIADEFLGLWHGADFYSREYKETPGPGKIPKPLRRFKVQEVKGTSTFREVSKRRKIQRRAVSSFWFRVSSCSRPTTSLSERN